MQARERILETIEILDEEAILKVYDFALTLTERKRSLHKNSFNFDRIREIQHSLSSIQGNLSDDIQMEREDRC